MSKGKLEPLKVPWKVSPSVSDILIEISENSDTKIIFNVMIIPQIQDNLRVELILYAGQHIRTYRPFNETHVIDPFLFENDEYVITDIKKWHKEWEDCGFSPNPCVFEVINSEWARSDEAKRFNLNHIVIEGVDLWIEVLCKDWLWHWKSEI